jgi:hypothetical protein
MNVDRTPITSPEDEIDHPLGSKLMTIDEKIALVVGMSRKVNEELKRLRHLHPDLKDTELMVKACETVVDRWLQFESPSEPRMKALQTGLLESWFEKEYDLKKCYKEGGVEGEGQGEGQGEREGDGDGNAGK